MLPHVAVCCAFVAVCCDDSDCSLENTFCQAALEGYVGPSCFSSEQVLVAPGNVKKRKNVILH